MPRFRRYIPSPLPSLVRRPPLAGPATLPLGQAEPRLVGIAIAGAPHIVGGRWRPLPPDADRRAAARAESIRLVSRRGPCCQHGRPPARLAGRPRARTAG